MKNEAMNLKRARKGKWNLVINCDIGTCNVSCCIAPVISGPHLGAHPHPVLGLKPYKPQGWEDGWQTFRRSQRRQEQNPRVTNVY